MTEIVTCEEITLLDEIEYYGGDADEFMADNPNATEEQLENYRDDLRYAFNARRKEI
jgi:hypothetical protein